MGGTRPCPPRDMPTVAAPGRPLSDATCLLLLDLRGSDAPGAVSALTFIAARLESGLKRWVPWR